MTERRAGRTIVRAYSTLFPADEDPIREGGLWINGKAEGLDFADVVVSNGLCHGGKVKMAVAERRAEQGNLEPGDSAIPVGDYDDPTAVLGGRWGRNQHAKGRVCSRNQTEAYFQEVELRLRTAVVPHVITGYEVFWRCLAGEQGYAEIVRWDGGIGNWKSLARRTNCGVQDGDLVEATIIGTEIRSYINGVEVLSAVDDGFAEGAPGVGFNFGCGDTYVDHGFTWFEVETWDD